MMPDRIPAMPAKFLGRLARIAWPVLMLLGLLMVWPLPVYAHPQPIALFPSDVSRTETKIVVRAPASQESPIEEYLQLWQAADAMPDFAAVRTLRDVIAYRPQSPPAYYAHLLLARHYVAQEAASSAEDAYRAALALHDTVDIRLELASFLERQADLQAAYEEYHSILARHPDAFTGMRRTGVDPLQVAADLNDATYFTDALETLRGLTDPAALPLRAQAYMGLARYSEAAATYRTILQNDLDDESAVMGLALAVAWLGDGEAALDLYRTVDSPDSRMAQAQLHAAEDPDRALSLYLDSPYPAAWWAATALLENQGRITETLPVYARIATSDIQYADDAAYRLHILGRRLHDSAAEAQGLSLLQSFGLNWLALRSMAEELSLPTAPAIDPVNPIEDKIAALASLGRDDLVRLELIFAARFRRTPAIDLAMAQALAARGDVLEAQRIAEQYINQHTTAPVSFWRLSYPRPFSTTVTAASTAFGVDPLLVWSVMREESRFDPDARSHADARGLMQVIPATQLWVAQEIGEIQAPGDAYEPETSIRLGAWLLGFLIDYFDGDVELALLAYNAGAASVETWLADPLVTNNDTANRDDLLRWIGFDETRLYLKRVALSYRVYRALQPYR